MTFGEFLKARIKFCFVFLQKYTLPVILKAVCVDGRKARTTILIGRDSMEQLRQWNLDLLGTTLKEQGQVTKTQC